MLKPKEFKRSFFGGFNRQSVIDYISALSDELSSLEEENSRLAAANSALVEENRRLSAALDGTADAAPSGNNASQPDETDVHDLSLDIGNILKVARECADGIIAEAEGKSNEIRENAVKNSGALLDTLNKTQEQIAALSGDLKKAVDSFE